MKEVLEKTKELIKTFQAKQADLLVNIPELSERLREVCGRIERSWSGSFAGWHGYMYFRDFQIPSISERFSGEWGGIHGIPDGWEEKQPEEVRTKIEELVGNNFSAKKFEDGLQMLRKEVEKLRNEITIVFSAFTFDSDTAKEKDIFSQIENFKFGKKKGDYIHERLPKTMMSRDTEALRQGICVASWLYYEGVALEGKSICEAISNFLNLSDRLVRQLEIKLKNSKKIVIKKSDSKTLKNRLETEGFFVESRMRGEDEHIFIGKKDGTGNKAHIVIDGKTGEIRIDERDQAPEKWVEKIETILTLYSGKKIKSTRRVLKEETN